MAAEQRDPQLVVAALTAALRRSGWYDRASLQDALYGWAASGLSVGEVRAWLAADIADPTVALAFRQVGIGPDEIRAANLGEQVSIGRLPIAEAARVVLGPTQPATLTSGGWRCVTDGSPVPAKPPAQGTACVAAAPHPATRRPARRSRRTASLGGLARRAARSHAAGLP